MAANENVVPLTFELAAGYVDPGPQGEKIFDDIIRDYPEIKLVKRGEMHLGTSARPGINAWVLIRTLDDHWRVFLRFIPMSGPVIDSAMIDVSRYIGSEWVVFAHVAKGHLVLVAKQWDLVHKRTSTSPHEISLTVLSEAGRMISLPVTYVPKGEPGPANESPFIEIGGHLSIIDKNGKVHALRVPLSDISVSG